MSVNDMKVEILKTLLETNDEVLLNQVKEILNNHETDLWDALSDEQKESITQGRKEIAEGKGIPHEEVMKKYSKYLNK